MEPENQRLNSGPPPVWYLGRPSLSRRAVLLCLAALVIPVGATLVLPEATEEYQVLAWLLLLVPAFLLAYSRGWRGVAIALALGTGAMATALAILFARAHVPADPALLIGVTAAYLLIALGIGFLSDHLHRARMRAEEMALTDELTGLPNRRLAALSLEREFAAAQRGRGLIIASFDLDRFKDYNDHHGHVAGDEALRAFGQILGRHTRAMNLSSRWGGEEFLSILSAADIAGALVFVERIRAGLRDDQLKQGRVTVSVGVAAYDATMRTVDDLLVAADVALYEAKAAGPDSVRVYQPARVASRTA